MLEEVVELPPNGHCAVLVPEDVAVATSSGITTALLLFLADLIRLCV